ncbi:Dynein family light intermediate chain,P-loop containing nucleoside triphosphate hydrolase [Cinara cedri]|uniref:Dynein light intermediate chain n=1 Tax=Cinara cedri TaxID=506608 RepID=A0A5E4N3U6_9HEMI|nr:Dynein family light intermediate chain,P-loop containing nucleoside triphosphate hydrolase [Cinara cedri]
MDTSTQINNEIDVNQWNDLLLDVQNKSRKKLPENKNVLLLGDSKSGKTTLVTKLQGLKDSKQGWGMEYGYIQVRDDSTDENAQLNVWTLDGDRSLKYLMKFALNEQNFEDTTIILVASIKNPWKIMESLEFWSARLQDHIDCLNLGMEQTQNLRDKCVDRIIDYSPPDNLSYESSQKVRLLNEGVLTKNLGLDVVVVITMTDCIKNLEIDNYSEEHFDYIQCCLRKFCLQFGAALFYVSVMEDKNCDLLYKYLMHRIYRFPFKTPALIVEKDSVFVPSGWDSMKKIEVLYENMQKIDPETHYSDAIPFPYEKQHKEHELQDEEEQVFLARQLVLLNQNIAQPQTPVVRKSIELTKPLSANKRISDNPPPSSERALASFFNALLQKKQESPTARTPSKKPVENAGSQQSDQTDSDSNTPK